MVLYIVERSQFNLLMFITKTFCLFNQEKTNIFDCDRFKIIKKMNAYEGKTVAF